MCRDGNYSCVSSLCSVSSRVLEIHFSGPLCGPKCPHELDMFQQLNWDIRNNRFSSSVGWLISLGKKLSSDDGNRRVKELQEELQFSRNLMERNVCGWCVCLHFLEQVSFHGTQLYLLSLLYNVCR